MTRFSQVTAALRRKSLGQYALLTLCCFVSVLLITAYASMMGSPTVLSVFPEGGDSRKQMTMIFETGLQSTFARERKWRCLRLFHQTRQLHL